MDWIFQISLGIMLFPVIPMLFFAPSFKEYEFRYAKTDPTLKFLTISMAIGAIVFFINLFISIIRAECL